MQTDRVFRKAYQSIIKYVSFGALGADPGGAQVAPDGPRGAQMAQMVPNGPRWLQTVQGLWKVAQSIAKHVRREMEGLYLLFFYNVFSFFVFVYGVARFVCIFA